MRLHVVAWLFALVLGCRSPHDPEVERDAGPPPAVTLKPELDPSENQIPGHPGLVEFVYPDGHSVIELASEVPDSIKFVDGKPVIRVVFTGTCINQIGLDGRELRTTLSAQYGHPGKTDSGEPPPAASTLHEPKTGRGVPGGNR